MSAPILYQYTDNVIVTPVTNAKTGESIDLTVFPRVEYSLGDLHGRKFLSVDLNSGIIISNNEFKITIDDSLIDSSIVGMNRHQLVCWNLAGDKLPPVFCGNVFIKPILM